MELSNILPPISYFTKDNQKEKIREKVLDKIKLYFNRYKDII